MPVLLPLARALTLTFGSETIYFIVEGTQLVSTKWWLFFFNVVIFKSCKCIGKCTILWH